MLTGEMIYRITGINPEPWGIGPLGTRVSGGKHVPYVGENSALADYQRAVRDFLCSEYMTVMHDGPSELEFYFWRKLETYQTPGGKKARRHMADATNLQKGLEDALQGLLFANDRTVFSIKSVIVEQHYDAHPGIIIVHRPSLPEWIEPAVLGQNWVAARAQIEDIPDLGNMI